MTIRKSLIALVCCFCSALSFAQVKPFNYEAKWSAIDSIIDQKGLLTTAASEVTDIYKRAKKDRNQVQLIKALIYQLRLEEMRQGSLKQADLDSLEAAIPSTPQPARSILNSILATRYWNYFQNRRGLLYGRTQTTIRSKDIDTWSAEDFFYKINTLYLASLEQERLLQDTRLDEYNPILDKGNMRTLRPTLYDLLAHAALAYFKTDEIQSKNGSFAFQLDDPAIFADAERFASHSFITIDTLSIAFKALTLFQQLIRFHLNDRKPDALLDIDIERLAFVRMYGSLDNKDSLYEKALKQLTDKYDREPAVAQAWYLQAFLLTQQASLYDPTIDTTWRYANVAAKAICDKVLSEPDSSEGRTGCAQLLQRITKEELLLQTEKVNIPGQPMRCLLTWKNFSKLYVRIIRPVKPEDRDLLLNGLGPNYWPLLPHLPAIRSYTLDLPETNDYQQHRTEFRIDSLPVGEYVVLTSSNPDFSDGKDALTAQFFFVSNISYINDRNEYYVLNRETGQPMPGVIVTAWQKTNGRKVKDSVIQVSTTDAHGHFTLPDLIPNESRALEFNTNGDHLFISNRPTYNLSYLKNNPEDIITRRAWFFTDRSIYRPGQTISFKAILTYQDDHQTSISPSLSSTVYLFNANGQKVDSLKVVTNEYGSYHGHFTLPERSLNGNFYLEDSLTGNTIYFSVEEYKRPRFYVEYEKNKGSYRLGDTIRITGHARAYAGNTIGGAQVEYWVVRKVRYPYRWMFNFYRPGNEIMKSIAHGKIQTNEKGDFAVPFLASPDLSVNKALAPIFNYQVTVNITDINGETRSAKTYVDAGYQSLQLSIHVPNGNYLPADSLRNIAVSTTNLSNQPQSAAVRLTIFPLQAPQRLIRPRYWQEPDQFLLTETEYHQSFPHDEYRNESREESWPRGSVLVETSLTTGSAADTLVRLQGTPFTPGWYLVEARAKDSSGQEVIDRQYVEVYDSKTGRSAAPAYTWGGEDASRQHIPGWHVPSNAQTHTDRPQTVEPGSQATIPLGSSATNVFVIRTIKKAHNRESTSYFLLNGERQLTSFPVSESDRGGFQVTDIYVKDNRVFTHRAYVNVPWTNKELQISYRTFRDKTLPGSEEKWEIQVSGTKREQTAAEVLSGMYDASLDQFKPQQWTVPGLYIPFQSANTWQTGPGFVSEQAGQKYNPEPRIQPFIKEYDQLIFQGNMSRMRIGGKSFQHDMNPDIRFKNADVNVTALGYARIAEAPDVAPYRANQYQQVVIGYKQPGADVQVNIKGAYSTSPTTPDNTPQPEEVQIRKDFSETAFFFPDLHTDNNGNLNFSFTMPDALTRWKWMTLAHTKDLAFAYGQKEIITQKQLMVQPNMPRFLREGDRLELAVKIVNLTDSELTGQAELALTDPTTGETADGIFSNRQPNQYFTVGAHQSAEIGFPVDIPFQYNRPVTYRLIARAKNYSDGEEATLPIVSNRMLVTESLPLNMPGNGTKQFHFEKLLQSGSSETLNNHALTVEFSSNPAWYAVQALPYLMEYPYECAEQTFNRFYANALASYITSSTPRIQEIFARWKTIDTSALLSNLRKNTELKSVLLEETPWVLAGKSESQQKKNIAILFDSTRMSNELQSSLTKLLAMQKEDGSFGWFKEGPSDRYITQYILTGIGHLQKLNALPASWQDKIKSIISAALPYLDSAIKKDYAIEMMHVDNPSHAPLKIVSSLPVQYLYMRSFFSNYGIPGDALPAVSYYRKQAQQHWVTMSKYMQGMTALALYRTGDVQTAKNILASLKESAITDPEKGMTWAGIENGYYWYQSPIEIESLLAEAFQEISGSPASADPLRTWLLKQKQTRNWPTTKSTADACYAMLLRGTDWLKGDRQVSIQLGNKTYTTSNETDATAGQNPDNTAPETVRTEAGTGYFKKVIDGPLVNPTMGNITVSLSSPPSNTSTSPAWGAIYWQYFDDLDKITPPALSKAPLTLVKKLFLQRTTDRGQVLEPIAENGTLHVGDKVIVRIELRADRNMEYVHMRDMRASCMEPVNVLSQYKWQGGLGYYESTKDVSTDFFFPWIRQGTYVFEYPLFVSQAGNFSNGVTSIECMYAPEFSWHSEGFRVNAETNNP